mgnify:CR=1 FL=1
MSSKEVPKGQSYNKLSDPNRVDEFVDLPEIEKQNQGMIDMPFFPEKTGLYLTQKLEDLPIFGPRGDCERLFTRKTTGKGKSGARILLTKDNYGHRGTGFGGAGGTLCEAIDIVAGSLSCENKIRTSKTMARANFATDASRIYLTERGDIQNYFGTRMGSSAVSVSSEGKAGIGMKSDHVLLIGRERVRILAGLGNFHGSEGLVNGQRSTAPKIELCRTNSTDSQPAVLGDNLVEYLKVLRNEIRDLRQKHIDLAVQFLEYQIALATHTHTGFGLGVVQCIPSFEVIGEVPGAVTDFFNTQKEILIDNNNSKIEELKSSGNDALEGSIKHRIRSSTVYIGK